MLAHMTRWLALCAVSILTNYLQTSQKHPPCRNGVSWPALGLFCLLVLHLLDFASELSHTLQLLSQAWFSKQTTNNSVNSTRSDLEVKIHQCFGFFEWRETKDAAILPETLRSTNTASSGKISVKRRTDTHLLYTHVSISQQQTSVRAWIFVD